MRHATFFFLQTYLLNEAIAFHSKTSLLASRRFTFQKITKNVVHAASIIMPPTNETTVESIMSLISEEDMQKVDIIDLVNGYTSTQQTLNGESQPLYEQYNELSQQYDATQNSRNIGRLLVVLAAIIYSTNFSTIKQLDQMIPTGISSISRFGVASLFITASVFGKEFIEDSMEKTDVMNLVKIKDGNTNNEEQKERLGALLAGGEVGLWYSVGYISQAIGLLGTDAGKNASFSSLAIIVPPILDFFFRGKKLEGKTISSLFIAAFGIYILQYGFEVPAGELSEVFTRYDLFNFMQVLAFGIGYWRLESVSKTYPDQCNRSTAGQILGVFLGTTVNNYLFPSELSPSFALLQTWLADPFIIKAVLWTGIAATAFALYLETVALKFVSATELTLIMTSIAVWGSLYAFITLGEVPSTTDIIGGFVILSACVVGNLDLGSGSKNQMK